MTAALLHLSDLHLGEECDDVGQPSKGSLLAWARSGKPKMQSHDPYIFWTLRTEIRAAARAVGAKDDSFDFVAITGDISTTATPEKRFGFAHEYLTGAGTPKLEIDPGRLFCVPGNHDKMWEKTLERYLKHFDNLPDKPPYLKAISARDGQRFLIFGIDSNSYEEGNIAEGVISPKDLGWLGEKLDRCEKNEPKEATRVLLLHHHPADLNRFRRWDLFAAVRGRFTRLAGGERLLKLCDGRVDLILHGHEHFPVVFKDADCSAIIVSAGTTSEWSAGKGRLNSFHVLALDGGHLTVNQFDWKLARFHAGKNYPPMRLSRVVC